MTNQMSKTSLLAELIEDQGMAAAELCVRVADVLNLALDQSGKTQKELAERLGIGESRVSQVLRGDGNMHIATFARFLRGIGYRSRLVLEVAEEDVPDFVEPRPRRKRAARESSANDFTHVIKQPYLDGSGASYAFTVIQTPEETPSGWIDQATEVVTVNGVTGETRTRKLAAPQKVLARRVGEPTLFPVSGTEIQEQAEAVTT
jgi:transcriptional regulator with XRE-family HTH domain